MSSLKDRLNAIREAEEAERAAKEAERLAIAAKREQMATVLSRRWPEIKAHLDEAKTAVESLGGGAWLRYETIASDGGDYATVRITVRSGGHADSFTREIFLSENRVKFNYMYVDHGKGLTRFLENLDSSLAEAIEGQRRNGASDGRARRREF